MISNCVVRSEPHDVDKRLADLGLREEWLLEAVRVGYAARAACTLNHPPLYPGVSCWAEIVRVVREKLLPHGFVRSDEGNLPFTVHDKRGIAIAVATGDVDTGWKQGSPCTKNAKGPRTREAIENNQMCIDFGGGEKPSPQVLEKLRRTWILLVHIDGDRAEIRAELSLPLNLNDEGRVDGWSERIILSATPLDQQQIAIPSDGGNNGQQSPEIVVEIKKRAGA